MNKITIQDIKAINSRFDLILIAARRARQIQIEEKEIFTKQNQNKCTVVALKEIEKILLYK